MLRAKQTEQAEQRTVVPHCKLKGSQVLPGIS